MTDHTAIDLDLTPALVEAIRGGAAVVSPCNYSPIAQYGMLQAATLAEELGQRPPLLAVPSLNSAWSAPLPPLLHRLIDDGRIEQMHVAAPHRSIVERARAEWDAHLAKFIDLEVFVLVSPWPSYIRQSCSQELGKVPLVRHLSKTNRDRPTIYLEFGPKSGRPPDRLRPGVISFWNPFAHLPAEILADRIITAGADLDRRSCSMCRLCPVSSLDVLRDAVSGVSTPLLEEIIDLESRSAFGFTDRVSIAELIDRPALPADIMDRAEEAQARALNRRAVEQLVASEFRSETLRSIRAIPNLQLLNDLAVYRQAMSDLLGVRLGYLDAAAIGAKIRGALSYRAPIPLAGLAAHLGTMH